MWPLSTFRLVYRALEGLMRAPCPCRLFAAAVAVALGAPAAAMDLSWSGFATVGYARSDQDFSYLRWIDDGGTFDADSVAGLQADLRFSPRWSASLQMRAAPALDHDSRWEVEPVWAFVAWRPADGWLLRAGKFRIPAYMYSEILDVGVGHDMARLPQEMYSIAPINETVGLSATYERTLDTDGDWNLAATLYGGEDETTTRGWVPNALPGVFAAGANFVDTEARSGGLVLDLSAFTTRVRLGVHRARIEPDLPLPKELPLVTVGPGLSYYRIAPELPGPPLQLRDHFHNDLYTLGLEHRFDAGWRVAAEYARLVQRDIEFGNDVRGGYLAVFRECGRFTPYLSIAKLKSTDDQLDTVRGLTGNPLPPAAFGGNGGLVNLAQEDVAAVSFAVDQQTLALGTSVLVPGGKLKMEWARTWVNGISRMVDVPTGEAAYKDRHLNVWTLNYSVAF